MDTSVMNLGVALRSSVSGSRFGTVFLVLAVLAAVLITKPVSGQQLIGYVDSERILTQLPDYASVQQRLDRQAADWESEIEARRAEVDELFRTYQSREMLYTREERDRKRDEIVRLEEEIERLRMRYFGPEGELFAQQDDLMRPLQERVLTAVEEVATREGYDYVLDKSGDYLFLFYREQYDLSDLVLQELGIDVDQGGQGRQSN